MKCLLMYSYISSIEWMNAVTHPLNLGFISQNRKKMFEPIKEASPPQGFLKSKSFCFLFGYFRSG